MSSFVDWPFSSRIRRKKKCNNTAGILYEWKIPSLWLRSVKWDWEFSKGVSEASQDWAGILFLLGNESNGHIYVIYSSFLGDFFIRVGLRFPAPSASASFRKHLPACFIFSGHFKWDLAEFGFSSCFFEISNPSSLPFIWEILVKSGEFLTFHDVETQ